MQPALVQILRNLRQFLYGADRVDRRGCRSGQAQGHVLVPLRGRPSYLLLPFRPVPGRHHERMAHRQCRGGDPQTGTQGGAAGRGELLRFLPLPSAGRSGCGRAGPAAGLLPGLDYAYGLYGPLLEYRRLGRPEADSRGSERACDHRGRPVRPPRGRYDPGL